MTKSSSTNHKTKLRVGASITLKKGKGKKRKYNKQHAIVQEVPPKGCWMTVAIQPKNQCQSFSEDSKKAATIKWYKRHCDLEQESCSDPFQRLGDEIIMHIFSFVAGDREEHQDTIHVGKMEGHPDFQEIQATNLQWAFQSVARYHAKMRAVSRRWKRVMDFIVSSFLGPIAGNLDSFFNPKSSRIGTRIGRKVVDWMVRHKLVLSTLVFTAELVDIPVFIELLDACDTQTLVQVKAGLNKLRHAHAFWGYFATNKNLLNGASEAAIDLSSDQDYDSAMESPVFASDQRFLHDSIASNCPNLKDAYVTLTLPQDKANPPDFISQTLFSMPSIEVLHLSLGYECHSPSRGCVTASPNSNYLTSFIENLSGLKALRLSTVSDGFSSHRLFTISSPTLESVNVINCQKSMAIGCTDCPRLQRYCCCGNVYGNGTMPALNQREFKSAGEQLIEGDFVAPVTAYTFPFFQSVPDTCEITLKDFVSEYGQYKCRWGAIQKARFNDSS